MADPAQPALQRCLRGARRCSATALALALLALAANGRAQPQPPATGPNAPGLGQAAEKPADASEPVDSEELDPGAEPSDDRSARRQCSAADVLSGLCTEADAARASAERSWRLMARAELQLPVVFDDSPETEMLALYYVGAEVDLPLLLRGLYVAGWLGVSQRFWRIEGQTPVDFEDPMLALGYRHSLPVGHEKNLNFVHRLAAYLPASRTSRYNLHYATLDWLTGVRYPLGAFMLGANVWAQYQFREYETQFGGGIGSSFEGPGGANTRVRFEGGGLLQYTVFDDASVGSLLSQASIGYRQRIRYDGSAEPDWYWAIGMSYTPWPFLSASVGLEHGYSDLLRGGIPHLVAFDRDETLWRIGLFGRY